MFFSYYVFLQNTRAGFQRINSRINTLFNDLSGKYGGSIQMSECGRRSRVCQVIGRYINCLHRCYRTFLCGCNSFLKCTQFICQCRLITYCGRHTSQQCRYFGTCLYETENIINKEQHVLMLFITEIFRHGQSCLSHTHTSSRRLIHLSKYQSGLIQNSRFFHFCPKVITFTGTFSNTSEDRISTMFCGDVTDQLLNQHGFTYTGATEQTDLTTLGIRCQKVDNLDTSLQHLYYRALIFKCWRFSVNTPVFFFFQRFLSVYRFSQYVKQSTKGLFPNRHFDTASGCNDFHISVKSFTGCKHNTTYGIFSYMLSHFHNAAFSIVVDFQGVLDIRQFTVLEFHIDDWSLNLYDFPYIHFQRSPFFLRFCAFAPLTTSVIS